MGGVSSTKGLIARKTTGAPILLRAFFKGSEVTRVHVQAERPDPPNTRLKKESNVVDRRTCEMFISPYQGLRILKTKLLRSWRRLLIAVQDPVSVTLGLSNRHDSTNLQVAS